MIIFRQSTASQEFPLGYFVDSTDGNTEETALTIANTDIKIWKSGATTLANKNSGGGTHISNGVYYAVADATDTDTIGPMTIFVHVSGALAVRIPALVLDEAVYDAVFGTTALSTYAGADTSGTTTLLSRIGTPSNLGGGATISANLVDIEGQTDDIGVAGAGLTAIPWNAAWDAEVQSEVEDAIVVHRLDELLNADSDIDGAAPPTVGSVFHELMTKTTGSFTYDQTTDSLEAVRDKLTDIETDTAEIGAAGAGLSAIPWNASWDAEVQSEVQDAIEANNLDHFLGTATGIPAVVAGTYYDQLIDDGTAAYDRTTDSLQALRDRGDAAWTTVAAAAIRSAVGLASANLDTQLDALPTTAEVNAEVDTALSDYGALKPTVAGRTLDVSVGGEAGIDWANVGSPTTVVGLSGTTVKTATDVETDTADIQSRLPAALTAGGNMKSDALAINGSTTAATNLSNSAQVIYTGTVTGATSTTTLVDSGLTQSANDFWNGRIIIFLTGALKYQATDITGFTAATDTLTFTATTAAPSAADTYVVL